MTRPCKQLTSCLAIIVLTFLMSIGCSDVVSQNIDGLYFYEWNEFDGDSTCFIGYEIDSVKDMSDSNKRVIIHYSCIRQSQKEWSVIVDYLPETYFTGTAIDTFIVNKESILCKRGDKFHPYLSLIRDTSVIWGAPLTYVSKCTYEGKRKMNDKLFSKKFHKVNCKYKLIYGYEIGEKNRLYPAFYDDNLILVSKEYPGEWEYEPSEKYPLYTLKRIRKDDIPDSVLFLIKDFISGSDKYLDKDWVFY